MKFRILLFILLLSFIKMAHAQTVVDIIVNSPNHNTLEAAVLAAGLEGSLSGDGPFTVFAPTDEAFKKLPKGALDNLLKDKDALKNVFNHLTAPQIHAPQHFL